MDENDLSIIELWADAVPKGGVVVEIGSMMGRSAAAWAMTCDPSVTIYCLDLWGGEPTNQIFDDETTLRENQPRKGDVNSMVTFAQNVGHHPNIIMAQISREMLVPLECALIRPDVVFLDAAHKNPDDWNLIQAWLPRIKPGGMLCGHDNSPSWPDVMLNVMRLETNLRQTVTSYKNWSSLWSFRV
jgi:hypothetical protein